MTPAVLLLCVVSLTSFPAVAFGWGRRLPPPEWTRLSLTSVAAGAILLEITLLLCSAPMVFAGLGIDPVGIVGRAHLLPGGAIAGWMSLLLGVGGLVAASAAVHRSFRLWRHAAAALASEDCRAHEGSDDVVVVASEEPLAMALPHRGRRIVISEGLVSSLDGAQLEAVVRHERVHVERGHHRYLVLVSVLRGCLGLLPWVASSLDVVALGLERWADEDAVRVPEDRSVIVGTLLRLTAPTAAPGLAGFSTPRLIAERIRALERPAPAPAGFLRPVLYLAVALLALPDVASLLAWMT